MEVAETVGSDSGIKQRWYRVYNVLCRQKPAEGAFCAGEEGKAFRACPFQWAETGTHCCRRQLNEKGAYS